VPKPSAVLVTTRTAPEYGACVLDVTAMTPDEGLTFLAVEIGRRRNDPRWGQRLDEATAENLVEMARRLDGHALALLLAAGQAGDMGPGYALAQVKANPARGETARRFDFSYNPLPESQKELLHQLAAFAAGFDLQAVAAICTPDDKPLSPDSGGVPELPEVVRASFVERHPWGPDYVRFRIHPVMREYLRHKAGEEAMAAHDRRMAHYFVALVDWGRQQLDDPETALQAVAAATMERANLLSAQEVCLGQGLWDQAVSLAYDLNDLFERSGHWADRRRALEAGIGAAREAGDENKAAELSHNLGMAYQDIGEYSEARARYEQSLQFKEHSGDKQGQAIILHQLGMLAQIQGDYDQARRFYQQSLDIEEQLGHRAGVAQTLHNLGALAQDQGDYDQARRLYQQSLDIKEQLGHRAGVATTLHQLGRLAEEDGDLEKAERLFAESLDTFEVLGSPNADIARRSLERVQERLEGKA